MRHIVDKHGEEFLLSDFSTSQFSLHLFVLLCVMPILHVSCMPFVLPHRKSTVTVICAEKIKRYYNAPSMTDKLGTAASVYKVDKKRPDSPINFFGSSNFKYIAFKLLLSKVLDHIFIKRFCPTYKGLTHGSVWR